MDKDTLRHFLTQTDHHIDQATQRRERQSRIVNQMKQAGQDSREADRLLAQFEMTLENLRVERRMIGDLLKSPMKFRPGKEAN